MHSSEDDHTFSKSGLRGIDETLQRELDTVQPVYFPTEVERYSSSDSEGEIFFFLSLLHLYFRLLILSSNTITSHL